ncbi:hypothetical protein IMCC26134_01565 [Verrucomicrobia bacterium IMCC26134]|nr:hypothetical protein IMCC26134_01565 [Verrucomicrobia bacterium IMCC26134]
MKWLLVRIKRRLGRLRTACLHVVAHAPDGSAVAVFGSTYLEAHFSRTFLGEDVLPVLRRGLHLREAGPALRRLARRHGLAVGVAANLPPAAHEGALLLPHFVCLTIDLPATWEAFNRTLGPSALDDLRRVRNQGFQVRITRDPACVDEFYQRLYYPTITSRYGSEAIPASLADLHRLLADEQTELVQIFLGERWVAGVLNRATAGAYRMHGMGWLQGDPDLLRKGVTAAVYQASLRRAFELGRRTCILGGTIPYLEDGVFAYKAKWGARLDHAQTILNMVVLHLDPAHPHTRRFLQTHTLIASAPGGRFVAYSAKPPRTDRTYAPALASLSAWYRLLDHPDPSLSTSDPAVPRDLQPWFTSEALPTGR